MHKQRLKLGIQSELKSRADYFFMILTRMNEPEKTNRSNLNFFDNELQLAEL